MNLDDAEIVLEFAYDAMDRGDESSIIELFDLASAALTPTTICNVLTATHWNGARTLREMFGWKHVEPSIVLVQRRADFARLASDWLEEHEPKRRLALLAGLVEGIEWQNSI